MASEELERKVEAIFAQQKIIEEKVNGLMAVLAEHMNRCDLSKAKSEPDWSFRE